MPASRAKILIVDDEPLVLEMFRAFFEAYGYEVQVSTTSDEALHLIEKFSFDSIICDVMLEELDGFDLLLIARKKDPFIGFVLITGSPCEKDRTRAKIQEAFYLTKPIGFDELMKVVQQSIDKDFDKSVYASAE